LLLITEPVPMTLISISFQGKLLGAWVDEARKVVTTARVSERICLDLRGLTFADSLGVELLRTLRKEGVPLLGCSPLIEGLLSSSDALPI
jgi:anti-anti-sigma regulatory factor